MSLKEKFKEYTQAVEVLKQEMISAFPVGKSVFVTLNSRQYRPTRMRVVSACSEPGHIMCEMYTVDKRNHGKMKRFVKRVHFLDIVGGETK